VNTKAKKPRRLNINFRQTAKSLRAAKQTQISAKINRNIPQIINRIRPKNFARKLQIIKGKISKDALRFAKRIQKKGK